MHVQPHLLSHMTSHISIVSCDQTMVENYQLERVLWLIIYLQAENFQIEFPQLDLKYDFASKRGESHGLDKIIPAYKAGYTSLKSTANSTPNSFGPGHP